MPISSGMRRPTNSDGSFLKPSTTACTVRSGWAAVETRPDSVMLTFWRYAAGCVRLYGSKGFRPRTKLTRRAVPLRAPPTTWVSSVFTAWKPSVRLLPRRSSGGGSAGACARAAFTFDCACEAAVFRCLRASASLSWAASMSALPGSVKGGGLGPGSSFALILAL
ncbi:hypothetical protein SGLAM104S_01463 [Streptomyces glaucescens]